MTTSSCLVSSGIFSGSFATNGFKADLGLKQLLVGSCVSILNFESQFISKCRRAFAGFVITHSKRCKHNAIVHMRYPIAS